MLATLLQTGWPLEAPIFPEISGIRPPMTDRDESNVFWGPFPPSFSRLFPAVLLQDTDCGEDKKVLREKHSYHGVGHEN